MLDIGWSEFLVIGVVALVVIGPRELPVALRTAGRFAARARALAQEFRSGLDDIARESELKDIEKTIIGGESWPKDEWIDADSVKTSASAAAAAATSNAAEAAEADATDADEAAVDAAEAAEAELEAVEDDFEDEFDEYQPTYDEAELNAMKPAEAAQEGEAAEPVAADTAEAAAEEEPDADKKPKGATT